MPQKKCSALYRFIRGSVRFFYPKITVKGVEHIPDEPVIIVGNHCQMNGPIVAELYMPVPRKTWCASAMMHLREVPDYAFRDFWSQKPRWTHPFYRLLSYLIAPLSVLIFNNAETIPVYHDSRIVETFRESVQVLESGKSVVIFPEEDKKHNHIVYHFQSHFTDVARSYHKVTGKALAFVPMYLAPELKTVVFGEPVRFDPQVSMRNQRDSLCAALMDRITELAEALPAHTVVPYRNIPRKNYPRNIPSEVSKP